MREVAFRPVVTEAMKDAMIRVLESGRYIRTDRDGDSEGKRFEDAFARFLSGDSGRLPSVANLSSGTAAMHLAWVAYDIGPGDEVIVPANTFSSVADCVWLVGAEVVTVDVEEDTANLDPDAVADAVTERTRGIMPVHTAGHAADMERILEVARRHDLVVIEDACQAVGGWHRLGAVGTLGDMGCYSFVQNKAMTSGGEGGAVASSDEAKVERVANLANHARGRAFQAGTRGGEQYRSVEHEEVGYMYRQSEILTAIGRVQLELLPSWIEARRSIAARYRERLAAIDAPVGLPAERSYATHAYVRFQVRVPDRDALRIHLGERGIKTKVHYPTPIHLDRVYRDRHGERDGAHPVTERLARETLSLPIYPQMHEDDVDYVVDAIAAFDRRAAAGRGRR
jgi:dTDP-4-amino-4,6-dideoxygalactose transaminase